MGGPPHPEPSVELLRTTWGSGREFLDAFDADGNGRYEVHPPQGRSLARQVEIGQTVVVELDFRDTDRRFRHGAKVVDRREGEQGSVTLEFFEEELEIRDLIVCCAEGDSIPYLSRRSERVDVWMPVALLVGDLWRRAVASELSELGAFINLADPPERGERVVLRFSTLGEERVEVDALVVYTRENVSSGPGCGLEFAFSSPGEEAHVQRLLRPVLEPRKR